MKPKYINNYQDLQTNHIDICNGFTFQALQKTQKAIAYINRAKQFRSALNSIDSIDDLLSLAEYREELVASCGFSDKAKNKLTQEELQCAIKSMLLDVWGNTTSCFKSDIVMRYLLTKGDTLGGSIRNETGAIAGRKLTQLILERLESIGHTINIKASKTSKTQSITWDNRILLFDVTPKYISKNIDLILLKYDGEEKKDLLANTSGYLACGELKGGIDPAGADEHWKTANSALNRIRNAFESKNMSSPSLFFIGAAIEASMASEIYSQLTDGKLTHAANLNSELQLNDLVDWLVSL